LGTVTLTVTASKTGATYDVRSLGILNTLSWETFSLIIEEKNPRHGMFMYKVLNDHAAPGLKEYKLFTKGM
jgi:hypothetical protein